MGDLAITDPKMVSEDLFERAATQYLRLMDEGRKRVRLADTIDAILERYPEYEWEFVEEKLTSKEFDEYLAVRRKDHLARGIGSRLFMAELAAGMSQKAFDEIMYRLENKPDTIAAKELVAMVKLGTDLVAKVDSQLEEATGKPAIQVNVLLSNMMDSLGPGRVGDYLAEVMRITGQDAGEMG